MVKHMKLWAAGALLLAVGGTTVASNMGFKFVPPLTETGKIYTLSLPLNNNYTTADSVFDDIALSCPGAPAKVERINPSVGGASHTAWLNAPPGDTNFTLVPGAGLLLQVNSSCTSWVVVGSHNPSFSHTFTNAGGFNYHTSIPYHTTATDADDIFDSITSCAKVERINVSTGGSSRTAWLNAPPGDTNFPVTIGQSYIIVVNTPGTTWVPSHY